MIFITEIIGVVTLLVLLLVARVKWSQKYWARKNVPYIKTSSLLGNMENPLKQKRGMAAMIKGYYEEFRYYKHGGVYFLNEPIYIPVDLDLIKCILVKDFQHFIGRGFTHVDEKRDPLSAHIFNLEGEKWKNMRVKLTPTFTSGKMKMMFQTLLDCGAPMLEHINNLSKFDEPLDIKDILACYTTDIIGSCAFGLECNSFKYPDAEFRKWGRRLLKPNSKHVLKHFLSFMAPWLVRYLPMKMIPLEVETFFLKTIKDVLDYRKQNNIKRNDFIDLFIEMQNKAIADNVQAITVEEIAAQSILFFLGGFETSSTAMTFCLFELAFNQDIQEKLRTEIRETMRKNNGVLTYDAVLEMQYMDQVVNETLRKYPPLPFLTRQCYSDYKVPDTDVVIEKGTKVFISVLGIHRNERFYKRPTVFDPARFSEENKVKRPQFCFLPFGEGPRVCIGLRFGIMQTKIGLSMLLNHFNFKPADSETYNIVFDPASIILSKKGPIRLHAEILSDRI